MRLAPSLAAASLGMAVGIAVVGFDYAEGLSYLGSDPRTCAHCHIMESQYASWQKASHHTSATCVECHLPDTFPQKYIAKARNGWNHSSAFTLQNFPEPIRITPRNAEILQANCVRCHGALVHDIAAASGPPQCVSCHLSVGHGDAVGLGGPWRGPAEEIHEQH